MTLACEDGELVEAHKVVPAPTNPSSKSKQASSSIDLGWAICSSAEEKKHPRMGTSISASIAATKGFMATLDLVVVHLLIRQMESLMR